LDLDATAQAELLRSRLVEPLELVDAVIERIEARNPALGAVVTPLFDEARAAVRGGLPPGPLGGVPMLVKDLVATVGGARSTQCTRFMGDYRAKEDSELVRRYRDAGLVPIGLSNASEMGLLPTTEPARFGATKNPWDLSRSPGGSSGGSAAAVAARLVAVGHANDWGGSIRIPAAACGLFGLKPSRARNPLGPRFGDLLSGLVHEHVVTRSVRDSARILDLTSAPDPGGPYCATPPARPFVEELERAPRRLRIGLITELPGGGEVHADCLSAAEDAGRLCAELGHDVEPARFGLETASESMRAFLTVYAAGTAALMADLGELAGRAPEPEGFEPLTWALAEMGRSRSAADYLEAVAVLQRTGRELARLHRRFDVILSPALSEPPVPLGTFDAPPGAPLLGFLRAGAYVGFMTPANISGAPSMSVPLRWNAAGLPIGVLFTAAAGAEGLLFGLAGALERARPWRDRRPPL
ncbi:MAG: amidase, partial [Deltaproteobacteria bacterium]|nr:amidase [Deltaproteobacteria bacterium]